MRCLCRAVWVKAHCFAEKAIQRLEKQPLSAATLDCAEQSQAEMAMRIEA
jgi:hypothetical protein